MDEKRPTYCRKCGAELPEEGDFCGSCGSPIGGPAPDATSSQPSVLATPPAEERAARQKIEDFSDEFVLPDPSVPPRIARALSIGWELHSKDVWNGVLVAFLFSIICYAISSVLPILNIFLIVAMTVGFIAWAEERRRGLRGDVGTMFRVGFNRFVDALVLGLVLMGIWMVAMVPVIFAYAFTVMGAVFAAIIAGAQAAKDGPGILLAFPPLFIGVILMLLFWFFVIIGPIVESLTMMVSWAIANGITFGDSVNWAWERLKRHFFGWWLAGLVLSIITILGTLACYIGVWFTMPWGYLAWAEIIAYKGEDTGEVEGEV